MRRVRELLALGRRAAGATNELFGRAGACSMYLRTRRYDRRAAGCPVALAARATIRLPGVSSTTCQVAAEGLW